MDPCTNNPKVCVLAGGIGYERRVSLESGRCVYQALKDAGMDVILEDITPDKLDSLNDKTVDVFFIALHGQFGEDGQLQQLLEEKSLCYTGSGPGASRLCMDKMKTKKPLHQAGIKTPKAIAYADRLRRSDLTEIFGPAQKKLVVKPISQGSSVGVGIVDMESVIEAAQDVRNQYGDCMIEQYIRGRELTVGILNGKPLPVVEIRPKQTFYDYHAKYEADDTEYLFDTIPDKRLIDTLNRSALKSFKVLGCAGYARVDFIVDNRQNDYVLELNTIPGMTTHSLIPKAAQKAGLTMQQLCADIVNKTWNRKKRSGKSADSILK